MTEILVHPQQLLKAARQLQASAKNIKQAIVSIDEQVQNLSLLRHFEGDSAERILGRYQSNRQKLLQIHRQIDFFAKQLEKIAHRFTQADEALLTVKASRWNELVSANRRNQVKEEITARLQSLMRAKLI